MKKSFSGSFPWRLYRRHLLTQILFVLPPFIAFLFVFSLFIEQYAHNPNPQIPLYQVFRQASFWMVLGVSILFVVFQAVWGLAIFAPLGRILREAQALEFGTKLESAAEEPDEWFELQTTLRKIQTHSEDERNDSHGHQKIFEDTLQNLFEGVLLIDRSQNILFMNKTLRDFTGYKGSVASVRLQDLFREPGVLQIFEKVQKTGELERLTLEMPLKEKESTHIFILSALPLKKNELVTGVAGIFNNITELKKAELFRTDLVANVSHEIRTPLTSLKGYAQALEGEIKNGNTPTAKKYLEIMGRSLDRLNLLISDLLDLSSLEGKGQLHIEKVNPISLTERVLTQLQPEIEKRQQTVVKNFLVEKVTCDSSRVEQVLLNILQNAIRYIPEKSQIEISWEPASRGVVLKIKDNGPGIAKEHLPRLFERFYRADKARSPDKGGTGLGLAIVKHIMQRHGGTVAVESELGQGTLFTCWFPLVEEERMKIWS
ncbi:MAG: ATP-binding protein [Bdellovibrionales bacterium]